MSFDNDLLAGAAADLAARVPALEWDPDGIYTAGETGLFLIGFPSDDSTAASLNLYNTGPDLPTDPTVVLGLQVAFRTGPGGDPREVNDLADAVYAAWGGLHAATFGPARIRQMWRQSWATPYETGRRWTRPDNYYLRTSRPAPAATPA